MQLLIALADITKDLTGVETVCPGPIAKMEVR